MSLRETVRNEVRWARGHWVELLIAELVGNLCLWAGLELWRGNAFVALFLLQGAALLSPLYSRTMRESMVQTLVVMSRVFP